MKASAALLLALHLCAATAPAQDTAGVQARRADSLFARYDASPSPGLAIAVVRDGRTVFRKGYGLADIEHRVPITPSTVFDVASVSKQFTGLAIAMLVAEGRIRLTDDIRRYIPELPLRDPSITVDHLLHHTSGLRDWPGTLSVGGWRFDDVISFGQILTMAYNQRELNFVPGVEHLYSNTGYNLLAELVQRVTGQSFRRWTTEQLFRPLGMSSSYFRDDHTEVTANRAFGYARASDGTFRHTPNALTALGSSSLFSTVDDLARWLANFDDAKVGGAQAMSLMRTRGVLNDRTSIPYAFGITHGTYRGLPMLTHSGSWASFSTYLVHFPTRRAGIVVLANSGSINAQDAVIRLADIFFEAELTPAVVATNAPVRSTAPALPAALLDGYAGLYRLGPGWYTRISRNGAGLQSRATREEVATMVARDEREFWVQAYGTTMTFERDASGAVTGIRYRGQLAPRVDSASRAPVRLTDFLGDYESDELRTTYRVTERNGALELQHPRHGTIPLTWLWREDFGSATWFMRSVEFTRDAGGQVTGFIVNGDARSRNIRFAKRR